MVFDKNNTKKYVLSAFMFVVGMLSVSISNFFGGYYCSVAVVETILFTILLYGIFDRKESFKGNVVLLILTSIVTVFSILFFVVNDIFNVPVYVKNVLNFWGFCVIASQSISILSIVYLAVYLAISLNKSKVELVEDKLEETETNVNENKDVEEETFVKNEEFVQEEVKSITQDNVKVDVPYMEEEK